MLKNTVFDWDIMPVDFNHILVGDFMGPVEIVLINIGALLSLTLVEFIIILWWLLCSSPALIVSFLVSTDSSPVSTDSSLLAFLLLETSPFNPNAYSSIKYLLLYILISLYFISFEVFLG